MCFWSAQRTSESLFELYLANSIILDKSASKLGRKYVECTKSLNTSTSLNIFRPLLGKCVLHYFIHRTTWL